MVLFIIDAGKELTAAIKKIMTSIEDMFPVIFSDNTRIYFTLKSYLGIWLLLRIEVDASTIIRQERYNMKRGK